jgi:hypothetical protein
VVEGLAFATFGLDADLTLDLLTLVVDVPLGI